MAAPWRDSLRLLKDSANRGELSLLVPFAQGWEAVESLGQWDVSPGICPVEAADPFHASFILPSCWETRGFVLMGEVNPVNPDGSSWTCGDSGVSEVMKQ